MPATTDLDRRVEGAILRDDRAELEAITSKYAIWKRRYTGLLFKHGALVCMQSFIDSGHPGVGGMAHAAARYTTDLGTMYRASHLPQTEDVPAEELVDILWARTDLAPWQAQNLARVIVGMVYVN